MRERGTWLFFTMRRSDGVRVHHEKKSEGVTVDHEKKSDGVTVHHKSERWGFS